MKIYWQAGLHLQWIDLFRALTARKITLPPTEHCSPRSRQQQESQFSFFFNLIVNSHFQFLFSLITYILSVFIVIFKKLYAQIHSHITEEKYHLTQTRKIIPISQTLYLGKNLSLYDRWQY